MQNDNAKFKIFNLRRTTRRKVTPTPQKTDQNENLWSESFSHQNDHRSKKTKTEIPLVVIVGPTASGKTDLAIATARKFNGELISADSRQVYQELDIGSGKDRSFPHHLIDVVKIGEPFSVAEYKTLADETIQSVFARHKLPMLVGGTGQYIDAVVNNRLYPIVPPDPVLRKKLENKSTNELIVLLTKHDPSRLATVDQNNRRRLVRALEIAIGTRKTVPKIQKKSSLYHVLILGIDIHRQKLYQNIDARVDRRMQQGMLDEVKILVTKYGYEMIHNFGLEYAYLSEAVIGTLSLNEAIAKLKFASHAFARRQYNWWRRFPNIHWLQSENQTFKETKKLLSGTNLIEKSGLQ